MGCIHSVQERPAAMRFGERDAMKNDLVAEFAHFTCAEPNHNSIGAIEIDLGRKSMNRFTLKSLPYPYNALEPAMSARTVLIHHDKHQGGYVDKLNQLVRDTNYEHEDLDLIIFRTYGERGSRSIFNNAAQLWNHEFFWQSLAPESNRLPPPGVSDRLASAFGSLESFRTRFVETAVNHFGNGWAWLTMLPSGALTIDATHDSDNPFIWGAYPLFVCDLWEHAYYLDYQQERPEFVRAVVDRLVNWKQVSMRFALASERLTSPMSRGVGRLLDDSSHAKYPC